MKDSMTTIISWIITSPVATLSCVLPRSIVITSTRHDHLANHTLPTLFSVLTNYYSSWLVCSAGLPGNTYLFCMVLESTSAEHLLIDSVVRLLSAPVHDMSICSAFYG